MLHIKTSLKDDNKSFSYFKDSCIFITRRESLKTRLIGFCPLLDRA